MTFRPIAATLLSTAALIIACGKTDTATSHNNPGTGSSTLQVRGVIDAAPSAGSYATSLLVKVRDGAGAKVSGASVALYNPTWGTVNLIELGAPSGDYGTPNPMSSFPSGDFGLTVSKGTDNVKGVVVGGLGPFAINAPTPNATVPKGVALGVSWTTPTQAQAVTLQTNQYQSAGPDTGTFTIPAANNPADPGQQLTIGRYNEVTIAGGLPGSSLRVVIESSVSYVVQ